uniref:Uncharacterized protein n=2 Tax=Meloidogyne TaxID=189290 RepID=A0A6V7Y4N5_MELEN|nr:unnamed protein product [Meloidogyne enterolobii]
MYTIILADFQATAIFFQIYSSREFDHIRFGGKQFNSAPNVAIVSKFTEKLKIFCTFTQNLREINLHVVGSDFKITDIRKMLLVFVIFKTRVELHTSNLDHHLIFIIQGVIGDSDFISVGLYGNWKH